MEKINSLSKSVPIAINNLDHLGLVAGLVDEIGLVEIIDEIVGRHKTEKVSVGQGVKSLILNGLGLVSAPLYLFSRFFEGKATSHLLGEGIEAEHLNDDRLGRVLDILWENGLNNIFMALAIAIVKKYDISVETLHLDSSSFHVHGEYNHLHKGENENEEPRCIEIAYGYSRDHRPDLKQFTLDLMCSQDGDMPLWMRTGSGNESDTQKFGRILQQFKKELDWDSLFVADSAFYSQENLLLSANLKWLSRVPLTLKSPQRIEALGLIMGLCLLVYSLGQRQLRQELQLRLATVPNQLGRRTSRPTLRWIFQCFQAIHVLDFGVGVQVSNLNEERLWMLKFFPPACQRYYLVG